VQPAVWSRQRRLPDNDGQKPRSGQRHPRPDRGDRLSCPSPSEGPAEYDLHNKNPCARVTPPMKIRQSIRYNRSMKEFNEIRKILREQKPYLAEKYGVEIVGVFGSYVRQEQRSDSDLDILIELDRPPKISLIGLVELEDYLSQILGVKVDLAIKTNLKKRIGRRILQEVIPI
jgi:uncharacterized protein